MCTDPIGSLPPHILIDIEGIPILQQKREIFVRAQHKRQKICLIVCRVQINGKQRGGDPPFAHRFPVGNSP